MTIITAINCSLMCLRNTKRYSGITKNTIVFEDELTGLTGTVEDFVKQYITTIHSVLLAIEKTNYSIEEGTSVMICLMKLSEKFKKLVHNWDCPALTNNENKATKKLLTRFESIILTLSLDRRPLA